MRLRHVLALIAPAALALPLAVPTVAHAESPFPYHDVGQFEDGAPYEGLDEDCKIDDYEIRTTVEEQGNHFARPVRDGLGQAWYGHDNFNATYTNTRVLTGDSFSVTFKSLIVEVTADHLEDYEPPADYVVPVVDEFEQDGPYYEFTQHEVVHATVRDDSGRVVSRERVVIRWRIIFNTLGDDEPGGETVVEFEPEIISGAFVLQDFCGLVKQQLD